MSTTSSDFQSAVVLHGPKDLRIEERPRLAPGPGECQVEIQATGLCGSDRKFHVFNSWCSSSSPALQFITTPMDAMATLPFESLSYSDMKPQVSSRPLPVMSHPLSTLKLAIELQLNAAKPVATPSHPSPITPYSLRRPLPALTPTTTVPRSARTETTNTLMKKTSLGSMTDASIARMAATTFARTCASALAPKRTHTSMGRCRLR